MDTGTMNDIESSAGSSYADSVFSIMSADSSPSFSSKYSSSELLSAAEELVALLTDDDVLNPLYHNAFKDKTIGTERFVREFERLLKIYSKELKQEVHDPLQKSAARLVRFRAVYITDSIRGKYDPEYNQLAKESKGWDLRSRSSRGRNE